jgi:hypothetical protein
MKKVQALIFCILCLLLCSVGLQPAYAAEQRVLFTVADQNGETTHAPEVNFEAETLLKDGECTTVFSFEFSAEDRVAEKEYITVNFDRALGPYEATARLWTRENEQTDWQEEKNPAVYAEDLQTYTVFGSEWDRGGPEKKLELVVQSKVLSDGIPGYDVDFVYHRATEISAIWFIVPAAAVVILALFLLKRKKI